MNFEKKGKNTSLLDKLLFKNEEKSKIFIGTEFLECM